MLDFVVQMQAMVSSYLFILSINYYYAFLPVTDPSLFIDSNPYAWSFVWKVFALVESIDVDKQVAII